MIKERKKIQSDAWCNQSSEFLPSPKVEARGERNFDPLQSSVRNNWVKNSGYSTSQSTGQSD